MELPKLEYGTTSKFLLSLSIYFLTITLLSAAFYWHNYGLPESIKFVLGFSIALFWLVFFVALAWGMYLLIIEDEERRIKRAIERDILLREYWIKCIEYNEKAKAYNNKYKTPSFPEKGALEFPEFLKEADSPLHRKIRKTK